MKQVDLDVFKIDDSIHPVLSRFYLFDIADMAFQGKILSHSKEGPSLER